LSREINVVVDKKKQVYKPGSVSASWRMLIIYLVPLLLVGSSCLPTGSD